MARLRPRQVMQPHPAVGTARVVVPAAFGAELRGSVAGQLLPGSDAQAAYSAASTPSLKSTGSVARVRGAVSQSPRRTSSNQKQCRGAQRSSSASDATGLILRSHGRSLIGASPVKFKDSHRKVLAVADVTWLKSCALWGSCYCCDSRDESGLLGVHIRLGGELS